MRPKIKEYSLVIALYLLATLIFTFPLVLHLSDYLAGDGGDAFKFVWNNWWYKKAVLDLKRIPFFETDFIFYPGGHTLLFDSFPSVYGVLSIPLQVLFGPFAAYNLLLIFSFLLTGMGMYLLLSYLTHNRMAAFIGGFIFVFSPLHMLKAQGHFHVMVMEWLPFYVLYFLKTHREYRLKHLLTAAFFLALAGMNTAYQLMYCLMFSVCYVVFFGIREEAGFRILSRTIGIFLAAAVLLSPMLIPMVIEAQRCKFSPGHPPEQFSADLLSFFVPNDAIQPWAWRFKSITSKFTGGWAENGNYFGYAVIFLSFYAVKKLWRKDRIIPFLAFAALAFFVLSLGMHLHVGGKVTDIPLPYMLAYTYMPGFAFSGNPQKIHALTAFCLACLSALAVSAMLRDDGARNRALVAGLFLLCVTEYMTAPFPLSATPCRNIRAWALPRGAPTEMIPVFYRKIARDQEDYSILDLANGHLYNRRTVQVFYYQTIHNKRLVGGNLARTRMCQIKGILEEVFLSDLLLNRVDEKTRNLSARSRQEIAQIMLDKYNIRYVVVPQAKGQYPRNVIAEFYGLCKIYEDPEIAVYASCETPMTMPWAGEGHRRGDKGGP